VEDLGERLRRNLGCMWPLTIIIVIIAACDVYYGLILAAMWASLVITLGVWSALTWLVHWISARRGGQ
jgi:hypothetical protein